MARPLLWAGGQPALPVEQALRVRVTAPLDWRVARISGYADLSTEEARSEVVTRDAERADFVSYHFRQQIQDAEHYDLVLNASRFTMEERADLVLEAYALGLPNAVASPSKERVESLPV
ncbi:MAG: cytidylate kinase [Rhodothermales bacterium]|jgi:cytidylate kinase